jgi:hypothetical protein
MPNDRTPGGGGGCGVSIFGLCEVAVFCRFLRSGGRLCRVFLGCVWTYFFMLDVYLCLCCFRLGCVEVIG